MKKYDYEILNEEVSTEDLFEDKTHEKIALSLSKLVDNEKKGITIGLEGPWGSGKSSIISMLFKNIKVNNKKVMLFQFDAWAHEGDFLRKIFLESLIDEISIQLDPLKSSEFLKTLDKKKKKINNQIITKTIERDRSISTRGILFTLSAILVPFGAAILSNIDLSIVSFPGEIYPALLGGILTCLAPLILALLNIIGILFQRVKFRDILRPEHWAFLQDNDSHTEEKEFSELDERTSVEFEKYFFEILDFIFEEQICNKLLIVIDNLDRIDKNNALSIWSTLQIFLQERGEFEQKRKNFDNVWIIVPYDSTGIRRLWEGDEIEKSFIDKSFQLRIDVPKPIFSSWENYTKLLMEKSIPLWSPEEKKAIIDILHLTRRNITDIPTPREIKNYINQVAYMASLWGEEFSIYSIAYYVAWRELKNCDTELIRNRLREHKLIKDNTTDATDLHNRILPNNIFEELSGLVFGVNSKRGYELLLLPEIIKALDSEDSDALNNLIENNEKGFWAVFDEYILTTQIDDSNLFKYSHTLNKSNHDRNNLQNFIKILNQNNLAISVLNDFFKSINYDYYKSYILLVENISFTKKAYAHTIKKLDDLLKNDKLEETWSDNIIHICNKLINDTSSIIDDVDIISIDFKPSVFITWSNSIYENNLYTIAEKIKPSSECINLIFEDLKSISEFKLYYFPLLYIVDYYSEQDWNIFIQNIFNYLSRVYNIDNTQAFRIIEKVLINDLQNKLDLTNLKTQWPFFSALNAIPETVNSLIAVITGILHHNDMQSFNVPNSYNALDGLNRVKAIWKSEDLQLAEDIIDRIKNYYKIDFVWDLIADTNNVLAFNIICIAASNLSIKQLFSRKTYKIYELMCLLGKRLSDEQQKDVLKAFKKLNNNYNEILNDIALFEDTKFNYYRISVDYIYNENPDRKVYENIRAVSEENWKIYLDENDYILMIIIEIKKHDSKFYLTTNYYKAICDYSDDIIHASSDILIDLHIWKKLIQLLTPAKMKSYISHVNKYFIENIENMTVDYIEYHTEFIDFNNLIDDKSEFLDILKKWIKTQNYELLEKMSQKLMSIHQNLYLKNIQMDDLLLDLNDVDKQKVYDFLNGSNIDYEKEEELELT